MEERETIGDYILIDKLGKGGFGYVFKALHKIKVSEKDNHIILCIYCKATTNKLPKQSIRAIRWQSNN